MKTIHDFEPIFLLTFVQMIRKGAAVRVLIYGSLLLIYIREIWKKAILDPFTTKGAISRKETTLN